MVKGNPLQMAAEMEARARAVKAIKTNTHEVLPDDPVAVRSMVEIAFRKARVQPRLCYEASVTADNEEAMSRSPEYMQDKIIAMAGLWNNTQSLLNRNRMTMRMEGSMIIVERI